MTESEEAARELKRTKNLHMPEADRSHRCPKEIPVVPEQGSETVPGDCLCVCQLSATGKLGTGEEYTSQCRNELGDPGSKTASLTDGEASV